MSIHGIIDAMRAPLPPATRLVWAALENHANGHRFWSISMRDLGEELHFNRDTILTAVKQLEAAEIVRIERKHRHAHTFYMLRVYPEKRTKSDKPVTKPHPAATQHHEPVEPEIPAQIVALEPEIPAPNPEPVMPVEPEIPALSPVLEPEIPAQTAFFEPEFPAVVESNSKNPTKEVPTNKQVGKRGKRVSGVGKVEPPGFADWWQAYPRKSGGRLGAAEAYAKALARGATPEQLMAGLQRYRFAVDPTKRPMAQTWLNQGRWDGECEPEAAVNVLDGLDPNKLTGFYKLAYRLRAGQLDAEARVPELEGIGHG